jgi:hypothetical protein
MPGGGFGSERDGALADFWGEGEVLGWPKTNPLERQKSSALTTTRNGRTFHILANPSLRTIAVALVVFLSFLFKELNSTFNPEKTPS